MASIGKFTLSCASMLILAGCVSAGQRPVWMARNITDRFSDETICRVQPGDAIVDDVYSQFGIPSASRIMAIYPYVERRKAGIRVGMIGFRNIPIGETQLRIDQNPAWTISPSETPVDSGSPVVGGVPPEIAASVGNSITQTLSPYTATTGAKAQQILAQLRAGSRVISRRVGPNAAASTTGEISLGADFNAALSKCGI